MKYINYNIKKWMKQDQRKITRRFTPGQVTFSQERKGSDIIDYFNSANQETLD